QAVLELAAYGVEHFGMAVTQNHRAPGADVIDVALAVLVRYIGAFGMLEKQRRAADAAEGAHRRVDATGDVVLGAGEEDFGTGHVGPRGNKGINDVLMQPRLS